MGEMITLSVTMEDSGNVVREFSANGTYSQQVDAVIELLRVMATTQHEDFPEYLSEVVIGALGDDYCIALRCKTVPAGASSCPTDDGEGA